LQARSLDSSFQCAESGEKEEEEEHVQLGHDGLACACARRCTARAKRSWLARRRRLAVHGAERRVSHWCGR